VVNGLGSVAGIITATTSLIVAIGGLIVSVRVLLPVKRTVDTVHTLVNQHSTDQQLYQQDLRKALQDAGVQIPVDKSLPEEA
jgi:hypothetical protein